jgi:hypothetical protein
MAASIRVAVILIMMSPLWLEPEGGSRAAVRPLRPSEFIPVRGPGRWERRYGQPQFDGTVLSLGLTNFARVSLVNVGAWSPRLEPTFEEFAAAW